MWSFQRVVIAATTLGLPLSSLACKPRNRSTLANEADVDPTVLAEFNQFIAKPAIPRRSNPTYLYHGLVLNANRQVLGTVSDKDFEQVVVASNGNIEALRSDSLGSQGFALASEGDAYINLCTQNQIPIPPPWGDSKWKKVGDMDKERLFAAVGMSTELWTFETSNGICVALPRYEKKDRVEALGIICSNKTSGATCFWDNRRGKRTRIDVKNGMTVADFVGADRLVENCTSCHRGDNPWVVDTSAPPQPTTKLPDIPYTPIGPAGWTSPKSENRCGSCHGIPELTGNYCRIMVDMFSKNVMPPGGFKKESQIIEARALLKECPPAPPTFMRLHSRWGAPDGQEYCLDQHTLRTDEGLVYAHPCHDGDNQEYDYDPVKLTLKSRFDGKCLDVHTSDFQQWGRDKLYRLYANGDCHGKSNQMFRFVQTAKDGELEIRDYWKNYCLNIHWGAGKLAKTNGYQVGVFPCSDTAHQLWEID